MKKKVYVVPHSHWDREWYFTISDSNIILHENLQGLIQVLATNPTYNYYVFDGQTSVIEEYLKWRPEDAKILYALIKEKKLFVGPWYTQCDTRIISIESLIRNLQYGTSSAAAWGHSQNIGYLPDVFGQHAYLPAIFHDFGIEYTILQRGVYTEQLKDKNLHFRWKSPNGVSIPTNLLYYGYGAGKFLSTDVTYCEQNLYPMLEQFVSMNQSTDTILLPAGGDQVFVREHLPQTIEKLNDVQDDYEFVLSNYEDFMQDTWANTTFNNIITGELIATERSRIHRTILSQRMDIKQRNARVEWKILQQLEPLLVYMNDEYPHHILEEIWKKLFDVQAHDSIGGCNSDDTNRDIIHRLQKAEELVDGLINVQKRKLSSAVLQEENSFFIFHGDVVPTTTQIELTLFTPYQYFEMYINNEVVPYTILKQKEIDGGKKIMMTAEGEKEVTNENYYEHQILLSQLHGNGLDTKVYQVRPTIKTVAEKLQEVQTTTIENNFYQVTLQDGKICVRFGETALNNLLLFENMADNGDSYDFAYLEEQESKQLSQRHQLVRVKKTEGIEQMFLRTAVACAKDRGAYVAGDITETLWIDTTITLYTEDATIHLEHEIENTFDDHRVRVMFPQQWDSMLRKSGFGLLPFTEEKTAMNLWREKRYAEAPLPVNVLDDVLMMQKQAYNMVVLSKTIKEFAFENQTIFLTLFRSVGLLGKDNLSTRPNRASGINNKIVETPDAQMHQTLHFTYGLNFFAQQNTLPTIMRQYFHAFQYYQSQTLNSFHHRLDRFELPPTSMEKAPNHIVCDNQQIVQSTLNRDEKGEIRIRFYNITSESQVIPEFPNFERTVVNMQGHPGKEQNNQVSENDYKTYKVWRKKNEK